MGFDHVHHVLYRDVDFDPRHLAWLKIFASQKSDTRFLKLSTLERKANILNSQ
jgi:hypothetical protein